MILIKERIIAGSEIQKYIVGKTIYEVGPY
jgi:hypothetical protein